MDGIRFYNVVEFRCASLACLAIGEGTNMERRKIYSHSEFENAVSPVAITSASKIQLPIKLRKPLLLFSREKKGLDDEGVSRGRRRGWGMMRGYIFTISLPVFCPEKSPMNASGALSKPSVICSRALILPSLSH